METEGGRMEHACVCVPPGYHLPYEEEEKE
jgi:hypothetical protein